MLVRGAITRLELAIRENDDQRIRDEIIYSHDCLFKMDRAFEDERPKTELILGLKIREKAIEDSEYLRKMINVTRDRLQSTFKVVV